jgi:hypothetical protein
MLRLSSGLLAAQPHFVTWLTLSLVAEVPGAFLVAVPPS